MLGFVLKVSILSFLFIFLVHHLFVFLKTTLTVPKMMDMVYTPQQKYQEIYNVAYGNGNGNGNANNSFVGGTTSIDLLPTETTDDIMKNELKNFLKQQMGNI
jgi:hypothetical protein